MIEGQTEAFPKTPAEIRIERLTKIQVKLTEDVDKAEKAIDNAVEKHRQAQVLLESCERLIEDAQKLLSAETGISFDPASGEVDPLTHTPVTV